MSGEARSTALECVKCGGTFLLVSIAGDGPLTDADIYKAAMFMSCPEPNCWGDLKLVEVEA